MFLTWLFESYNLVFVQPTTALHPSSCRQVYTEKPVHATIYCLNQYFTNLYTVLNIIASVMLGNHCPAMYRFVAHIQACMHFLKGFIK